MLFGLTCWIGLSLAKQDNKKRTLAGECGLKENVQSCRMAAMKLDTGHRTICILDSNGAVTSAA